MEILNGFMVDFSWFPLKLQKLGNKKRRVLDNLVF